MILMTYPDLLIGNPGESISNTAIAHGVDDDDAAVMASGSETADINDVAPHACPSRTVTGLPVTDHIQACNNSGAKSISPDTLDVDIYVTSPTRQLLCANRPAVFCRNPWRIRTKQVAATPARSRP